MCLCCSTTADESHEQPKSAAGKSSKETAVNPNLDKLISSFISKSSNINLIYEKDTSSAETSQAPKRDGTRVLPSPAAPSPVAPVSTPARHIVTSTGVRPKVVSNIDDIIGSPLDSTARQADVTRKDVSTTPARAATAAATADTPAVDAPLADAQETRMETETAEETEKEKMIGKGTDVGAAGDADDRKDDDDEDAEVSADV